MKAFKYALLGLAGIIGLAISTFGPVKVPFAESLAKSYYRYALGALMFVLLLISVAVGLFIFTFDANNFKSEIVQFVKERTQRDLVLQGSIKVTFFPKLGLDSGHASLSQRNSAKEFASINNARLYIAWLPLFKRKLVFDRVEIDGIRANVVHLKDGSTNYDDLLISDERLAPLTFDIDSVRITGSSINWLDETESQRVTLQNLLLETGRLADKLPSHLTASFRLNSETARLNADVRLKSRLFFDRKAGRYEFADIEGKLEGEAARINGLALNFAGSLDSYPAQKSLTAENFVIAATGKSGQRLLGIKFSVPKLHVDKDSLSGNQFTLEVSSSYLNETLAATVQLPAFEIVDRIFKAAELAADFAFTDDGRALQGRLASPAIVSLETAPKLQLDAIVLSLSARHPALSGELAANATGSMRADFAEQSVNLGFNVKIDDSKLNGTVALKDFSRPVYTFEIDADRLDLDRYVAADWIKRFQDDATPFAPVGLRDLTLRGSLRAGEIIMAKTKASKLSADIKFEQSTLTIAPLAAKLYGGTLTGSIGVAVRDTPQITVKQNLRDFQMNALLANTAGAGRLTGKGNLALDLNAVGDSVGALRKTVNGRVSLALAPGSLAGIDLRAALLEGKNELGTGSIAQIRAAKFTDKTEFSELKVLFNIKDGSAVGNSFEMKSPLIRTVGEGDIDFGSGDIDYRLNSAVSSVINRKAAGGLAWYKGITVPIRVNGSYAAPSIALDFGSASGGNVARLSAAIAAKAVDPTQTNATKTKTQIASPVKK